jgi:hypothetical protein
VSRGDSILWNGLYYAAKIGGNKKEALSNVVDDLKFNQGSA